jgi:hypothetical protein
MLDATRNLLGDVVSGKIKDQRLSLLADELKARDIKLSEATLKISDLESRLQKSEARLHQFEAQKPADICPFCRCQTGELVNLKPHPEMEHHGWKVAYYKCSNTQCGRTYDKILER